MIQTSFVANYLIPRTYVTILNSNHLRAAARSARVCHIGNRPADVALKLPKWHLHTGLCARNAPAAAAGQPQLLNTYGGLSVWQLPAVALHRGRPAAITEHIRRLVRLATASSCPTSRPAKPGPTLRAFYAALPAVSRWGAAVCVMKPQCERWSANGAQLSGSVPQLRTTSPRCGRCRHGLGMRKRHAAPQRQSRNGDLVDTLPEGQYKMHARARRGRRPPDRRAARPRQPRGLRSAPSLLLCRRWSHRDGEKEDRRLVLVGDPP
jgi:hypothetical protein